MLRALSLCRLVLILAGYYGQTALAGETELQLPRLDLTSVDGQIHRIAASESAPIEAIVFVSPECPISCQYVPELNRLHQRYAIKGVRLAGAISDPSISRSKASKFAQEFQLQFPLLFDSSGLLADACKPSHVPEVFVFHQAQLVYRGRIDNTYTAPVTRRQQPTVRDLVGVLDSLAAGEKVDFHRTEPVGCPIEQHPRALLAQTVTYNRDIAPIVHAHCTNCHRDGEVAPFALASYGDVAKRAAWILEVVESGFMPPWRAKQGHGQFKGERHLTDGEVGLIKSWVSEGAPEGNPDDLPPLPRFASGWRLGQPDLVVRVPDAYEVPADGPDVFRNFAIKLDNREKIHVKAIEFQPGNRRVVHHALVLCDPSSRALERDASDPEAGYPSAATGVEELVRGAQYLDVWAPGVTSQPFPPGVALPVEPGSALVINVHYHPSGKPESDQSLVGLYLADESEPISHPVFVDLLFAVASADIDIPPGARGHRITADFTLPTDIKLLGVFPHMHYLGTEMKAKAIRPDGQEEPLVWIEKWDFNWQDKFVYSTPLELTKGTRLDLEAWFDNSADNPHNRSDPPQRVLLGEESTDEMCLMILQAATASQAEADQLRQGILQATLKMMANAKMNPEFRRRMVPEILQLINSSRKKVTKPE